VNGSSHTTVTKEFVVVFLTKMWNALKKNKALGEMDNSSCVWVGMVTNIGHLVNFNLPIFLKVEA